MMMVEQWSADYLILFCCLLGTLHHLGSSKTAFLFEQIRSRDTHRVFYSVEKRQIMIAKKEKQTESQQLSLFTAFCVCCKPTTTNITSFVPKEFSYKGLWAMEKPRLLLNRRFFSSMNHDCTSIEVSSTQIQPLWGCLGLLHRLLIYRHPYLDVLP